MGPAINISPNSGDGPEGGRIRGSLALRILALNILALLLLGGSVFYLDGFRTRLLEERRAQQEKLVLVAAASLATVPPDALATALARVGPVTAAELRIYRTSGALALSTAQLGGARLTLVDPEREPWRKHVARLIDRVLDRLVDAPPVPAFHNNGFLSAASWPELRQIAQGSAVASRVRYAPDRTYVVSAAAPIRPGLALLSVENARDVTRLVRAERLRLGQIVALALFISAALSIFLARTIVDPLRSLARAAIQVRLGRARDVTVPRLPGRRDEIGLLARALSDMTTELRERIDASEGFAADVAHELKNPLASMRSAVDTLERVEDPTATRQLLTVLREDVVRLDRLITDIAELSRLDAQLTRTPFAEVDLGSVVARLLRYRDERGLDQGVRIAFARPARGLALVRGDADRLARAVENLIDNAVSFSPHQGVVRVEVTRVEGEVLVSVEDEGPGVPKDARERIFNRFHSDRPSEETFGRHSGLGLAITRTIVEGHNGTISVAEREENRGGRFVIRLPAA